MCQQPQLCFAFVERVAQRNKTLAAPCEEQGQDADAGTGDDALEDRLRVVDQNSRHRLRAVPASPAHRRMLGQRIVHGNSQRAVDRSTSRFLFLAVRLAANTATSIGPRCRPTQWGGGCGVARIAMSASRWIRLANSLFALTSICSCGCGCGAINISPLGKTPVLLVDDAPVFESAVICEYLDETLALRLHPADALERAAPIMDGVRVGHSHRDSCLLQRP